MVESLIVGRVLTDTESSRFLFILRRLLNIFLKVGALQEMRLIYFFKTIFKLTKEDLFGQYQVVAQGVQ